MVISVISVVISVISVDFGDFGFSGHRPLTMHTNYLANTTYSTHFKHKNTTKDLCLGRGRNLSVEFGSFRQCGTVFYLVRYGAVRCIHLVTPDFGGAIRNSSANSVNHSRNWPRSSECGGAGLEERGKE